MGTIDFDISKIDILGKRNVRKKNNESQPCSSYLSIPSKAHESSCDTINTAAYNNMIKRANEIKKTGIIICPKEFQDLELNRPIPKNGYESEIYNLPTVYSCKVSYLNSTLRCQLEAKARKGVFVSPIMCDTLIPSNLTVGTPFLTTSRHFAPPFVTADLKKRPPGCLAVKFIRDVSEQYFKWLVTDEYLHLQPERRNWIISQIVNGNLDGKILLYHKDLIFNHAETLAFIVKYRAYLTFTTSPVQLRLRKKFTHVASMEVNHDNI